MSTCGAKAARLRPVNDPKAKTWGLDVIGTPPILTEEISMFEIKSISVNHAANNESLQVAQWVCSVELDDALTVLIDGRSAHNIEDEEDWFSDATIRYPADAKPCDIQLLDLVGCDVQNECGRHRATTRACSRGRRVHAQRHPRPRAVPPAVHRRPVRP